MKDWNALAWWRPQPVERTKPVVLHELPLEPPREHEWKEFEDNPGYERCWLCHETRKRQTLRCPYKQPRNRGAEHCKGETC